MLLDIEEITTLINRQLFFDGWIEQMAVCFAMGAEAFGNPAPPPKEAAQARQIDGMIRSQYHSTKEFLQYTGSSNIMTNNTVENVKILQNLKLPYNFYVQMGVGYFHVFPYVKMLIKYLMAGHYTATVEDSAIPNKERLLAHLYWNVANILHYTDSNSTVFPKLNCRGDELVIRDTLNRILATTTTRIRSFTTRTQRVQNLVAISHIFPVNELDGEEEEDEGTGEAVASGWDGDSRLRWNNG